MQHYRTALVLGLGSSGEAAARLLLSEGAQVAVIDCADSEILRCRAAAMQSLGASVFLGTTAPPQGDFEIAIVSPGIASSSAMMQAVVARQIPVMAELELGWSRCAGRTLAVSGSNGKSTLVKLCAEAMMRAGRHPVIAGNYGLPVSAVASARCQPDWLVLEVSSFQLETARDFRPDVGILLNVAPNHLDHHGDFQTYRRIKSRLFARMTTADTGVVERRILPEIKSLAGSPNRWLSAGIDPPADFFYRSGAVHASTAPGKVEIRGTLFDNAVMGLTAAAAAAALSACGVELRFMGEAVREFRPLPHRLQDVGVVRGVRFVDDSKATNLAAMLAALTVTPGPIRLIAGGLPKGEDFEPARNLLAEKAAAVYLIGRAAEAMRAAWRTAVPCVLSATLEQAVAQAWHAAAPGDTILLSPACASFDQFSSFAARGESFLKAVRALS